MVRQQQDIVARRHRTPNKVNAWILGSSIASLASAVHLISDANVPASQIHILESRSTPGDGITSTGDPMCGYDHRPGCLPNFSDGCLEKLLALVPSTTSPRTVLKDMENFQHDDACRDVPITHVLIQGDHGPKKMETRKLGLTLKDRMKLTMFLLRSEKSLARKRINQLFNEPFFDSMFWTVFSTLFTFQPWHSAAEFRRCLRKYFPEYRNLNTKRPLDCTQFNQFESIILPIIQFLQNQGVDFRLCTKVIDILTYSDCGTETVSAIHVLQDNSRDSITVYPNDVVIVSLGSVSSGSLSGTNKTPPSPESMIAEDALDENWSLWLNLGTKLSSLGNPYNFCTHVTESRLETFTVTLKDTEFFDRFVRLTSDEPGIGSLVSLKDSNWKISVCLPRQPFFPSQPDNIQAFWGYGLYPVRKGNFVEKPMIFCTGEEIMTELLWHLGFPSESILNNSITMPCVMPRRTASLLPRTYSDRPKVSPAHITNVAVIGQFVEIPDETSASMEYGVRGAQLAVSQLMGNSKEPEKRRKWFHLSFLGLWA